MFAAEEEGGEGEGDDNAEGGSQAVDAAAVDAAGGDVEDGCGGGSPVADVGVGEAGEVAHGAGGFVHGEEVGGDGVERTACDCEEGGGDEEGDEEGDGGELEDLAGVVAQEEEAHEEGGNPGGGLEGAGGGEGDEGEPKGVAVAEGDQCGEEEEVDATVGGRAVDACEGQGGGEEEEGLQAVEVGA